MGDAKVGALLRAAPEPPKPVLVVGYGSSLRGDDAVGQRVVEELRRRRRLLGALPGARFVLTTCLTPELAEDLAGSGFAVLADAASDGRPAGAVTVETVTVEAVSVETVSVETVTVEAVVPGTGTAVSGEAVGLAAGGCWEDLSPHGLLRLARDLYGRAPPAVLVSVGVGRTSFGEGLSAPVEAAAVTAALAVEKVLENWASGGRADPCPSGSPGGISTVL